MCEDVLLQDINLQLYVQYMFLMRDIQSYSSILLLVKRF